MEESRQRFFQRIGSMRQVTSGELINTYWQHAHEIAQTGRLAFVLRGNAAWESEKTDGVTDKTGFWLKSARHEIVGRPIGEEPVKTYLQLYMNIYEIWGTLKMSLDLDNAHVSKSAIENALGRVTFATNAMSFLFGTSLQWFPARYLSVRHIQTPTPPAGPETENWECLPLAKFHEERMHALLRDSHVIDELFPFIHDVGRLQTDIRRIIETAIDWHAQANRYTSGLNRFINYWTSIELLGHFWYENFYKKSGVDGDEDILRKLKQCTRDNYRQIIIECHEIIKPTAKTKIRALLNEIVANDNARSQLSQAIFDRDPKSGKKLYDIRNDVAHGNISEGDIERTEAIRHQLYHAQELSKEIILHLINWSQRTEKHPA